MDSLSIYDVLARFWGYDTFRLKQEQIIESVMAGRDTLALLPTGGGKSLCYQVPALCKEGVCLVFSPLISLMNDQVQSLKKRGIVAELIHSGLSSREIDIVFDNAQYGKTKFLYLSPERLISEKAFNRLIRLKVNLLAVDEAHCISQWGYDFRPAYLDIAKIREWFPGVPCLALTATATQDVTADIQEKLLFKHPNLIASSFYRSNLSYVVIHEENKLERIASILSKSPSSSIVYSRNRKSTKLCAEYLNKHGIQSTHYHAGLSQDERIDHENLWKSDQVPVICATNAFGMGIDKPDVRYVIHLDLPNSMEAYFQEAGRAGRDGQRSYAIAFIGSMDKTQMIHRFETGFPTLDYIKNFYKTLAIHFQIAEGSYSDRSYNFEIVSFCEQYKFDIIPSLEALKVLEHSGHIMLNDSVFQPSTVQILVDKEELYRYQVKHAEEDAILKVIMRTYEGVFFAPVRISEFKLAKSLEIHMDDLVYFLQSLHQAGIIQYNQKSEDAKIVFRGERIKSKNLEVDQKWYDFRKSRSLNQIEQVWKYIDETECRSMMMQKYFGESQATPCGICDLCIQRKKEQKDLVAKVKVKLDYVKQSTNAIPIKQFVDSFSYLDKEKVLSILKEMENEKLISTQKDILSVNSLS